MYFHKIRCLNLFTNIAAKLPYFHFVQFLLSIYINKNENTLNKFKNGHLTYTKYLLVINFTLTKSI